MVGMSMFDETLHPRGQAGNSGQFRRKVNDAPSGSLEPEAELAAAAPPNVDAFWSQGGRLGVDDIDDGVSVTGAIKHLWRTLTKRG